MARRDAEFHGSVRHLVQTPVPTREEEQVLLARMAAGDESAREALAMGMSRLVARIAARYKDHDVPHEDLFMAGMHGCLEGLDHWDHEKGRGFRVASYAGHWIRMRITRHLSWTARTVRIPERALTVERQMKRGERVSANYKHALTHAPRVTASLDEPVESGEPMTLGDTIAHVDSHEDRVAAELDVENLLDLDCLDDRDRHALRRLYLDGAPLLTVAKELRLTRPRTRELCDDALTSVRDRMACLEFELPTRPKPKPKGVPDPKPERAPVAALA